MDYPIAIAKNVGYIAKWRNIGPEDAHLIEGVILSEDFREKDAYVVEFS